MDNKKNVYITKHGEKYHIDINCTYILGKKPFPITFQEAIIQKREPCKGCSSNININYSNKNFQLNKNWNNKFKKNFDKNNFNNKKVTVNNNINSLDADNAIFSDISQSNNKQIENENYQKVININSNISNSDIEKKNIIYEKKESSVDIDFNGNINSPIIKNNPLSKINIVNKSSDLDESSDSSSSNYKLPIKNDNNNIYFSNSKNNIINNNNKNYYNYKLGKKHSEQIQNLIQKDKQKYKNYNLKYNYNNESNQIEDEKLIENENNDRKNILFNINNSSSNNINIKNENNYFNLYSSYYINSLYLSNLQYLFNYFNNNKNIEDNSNLNSNQNDMNLLEETNNKAERLLLHYSSLLNGGINKNNDIKDKIIIQNEFNQKGCYKYNIEITPFREENNFAAKISVGFEVEYINISDMNIILDENMINKENIDYKIGALCENDEMKKNLIIFKKTGIIYILINVNIGKMFIVGKNVLEKKKKNNEIFYIKNFNPINILFLKRIKPFFQCDKSIFKNFEIKINDKSIK